jgi:hypothetical protein
MAGLVAGAAAGNVMLGISMVGAAMGARVLAGAAAAAGSAASAVSGRAVCSVLTTAAVRLSVAGTGAAGPAAADAVACVRSWKGAQHQQGAGELCASCWRPQPCAAGWLVLGQQVVQPLMPFLVSHWVVLGISF